MLKSASVTKWVLTCVKMRIAVLLDLFLFWAGILFLFCLESYMHLAWCKAQVIVIQNVHVHVELWLDLGGRVYFIQTYSIKGWNDFVHLSGLKCVYLVWWNALARVTIEVFWLGWVMNMYFWDWPTAAVYQRSSLGSYKMSGTSVPGNTLKTPFSVPMYL